MGRSGSNEFYGRGLSVKVARKEQRGKVPNDWYWFIYTPLVLGNNAFVVSNSNKGVVSNGKIFLIK